MVTQQLIKVSSSYKIRHVYYLRIFSFVVKTNYIFEILEMNSREISVKGILIDVC